MRAFLSFWRNFWRLFEALGKRQPLWGAQEHASRLLLSNLSPTQRAQFSRYGNFEVIGCDTGTRYRIREGYFLNIERLDKDGRRTQLLCFGPRGTLPMGDVLLAQKLALELFEADAVGVANATPPHRGVGAAYSGLLEHLAR